MSWMNRLIATGTASRSGRPHRAEPEVEGATLDGVLGFITAVYGVSLTPSDPLVVNRLGARRSGVVEGATLEQLVRTAGDATAETCQMLVDHLPFAVVIADATGQVLLANDPALHALRLGEMIASRDGRIHVADPVASDQLHAAIERACAPRGSDLQPVLIPVTPEAPWRQRGRDGDRAGTQCSFRRLAVSRQPAAERRSAHPGVVVFFHGSGGANGRAGARRTHAGAGGLRARHADAYCSGDLEERAPEAADQNRLRLPASPRRRAADHGVGGLAAALKGRTAELKLGPAYVVGRA